MARSYKEWKLPPGWHRDPRIVVRMALGVLLAANLIAAYAVVRPVGGSSEELERQLAAARTETLRTTAELKRLKEIEARMGKARKGSEQFLKDFFMMRRTASSTIVGELAKSAQESGIKPKEHSFLFDPIEGTEDLTLMTITANYEGTYRDLLAFVNQLDKSPRFLILDSLTATPQQGSPGLNVALKVHTFVREEKR